MAEAAGRTDATDAPDIADMATGLATEFVETTARKAGGEDVLDLYWGVAIGQMISRGWRVLPPRLQVAADTVLEEEYRDA